MTGEHAPRDLDDRDLAWLAVCGLLVATVVIYTCTLTFGYVFDDHLTLPRAAQYYWYQFLLGVDRYPLTLWSFEQSASPAVQHAWNLSLHLGNCWLFYALLDRWGVAPAARACAVVVAALHPLQIETVAYVSGGRPELLIALGVLLAAHGIEDAPRWPVAWGWRLRHLRAVGLLLLGMLVCVGAKPAGVAALIVIFALGQVRDPARHRWLRWPVWLAVVIISTNYIVIRGVFDLHGWAYQARVALQLAAVHRWVTMVLVPWGQTADWNVGAWGGWIEVRVIAFVAACAWACAIDTRLRALVLWLVLCFGWRVLIPSSEWIGEGDGYLALFGVALAIGVGAEWLFTKEADRAAVDRR